MSGLRDILKFEGFNGKKIFGGVLKDPSRLITGVDPFSTKVWNKILGTHKDPLVDQMGGATNDTYKEAEAAGINTGPGHKMQDVAHVAAAIFAANGLAGIGGGAAGAGAAPAGAEGGALAGGGGELLGGAAVDSAGLGGAAAGGGTASATLPSVLVTGTSTGGASSALPAIIGGAGAAGAAGTSSSNSQDSDKKTWRDYAQQGTGGSGDQGKRQPILNEVKPVDADVQLQPPDLLRSYNENSGPFNDGRRIDIRGNDAYLYDSDGNLLGQAPAGEGLYAAIGR